MIPYGFHDIQPEDTEAVLSVLRSDWLTQGPWIPKFEQAVAECCGAAHAVAVNSATSALHIACLALDLGPGDWLWTSPNTFVASANCGIYCGAQVDFVDIDPRTYNLSVESLAEKLSQAERQGCLPKVVIPVHFAGQACEMVRIRKLADQYGFRIIEDASHAIGARHLGESVGNCRYSDITIFSFHPVKIITTGEGGVATTNDAELAARMQRLRCHGITREPGLMQWEPHGPWYYQQIELGYNYRMTDMQAALGYSQLQRLDRYVLQRHQLKDRYDIQLSELPVIIPSQHPDSYSSLHLYPIQIINSHGRPDRLTVFQALKTAGIGVNVHYIPVHTQPYYQRMGFKVGDYPNAELYYSRAISLPMFATLSEEGQDLVISALRGALK
ncbi:MAG: UDP-4-amino-4,6-dideoxy-N-acetyl-beta-L-altrosamine transaminase [Desulfobacteraceae bacterium]|nr:UDP-4-amino-4,6-dideoxy-N-acetyl-beta-L-altrosamine transaminase [Desulfobacteraceae bacterium]